MLLELACLRETAVDLDNRNTRAPRLYRNAPPSVRWPGRARQAFSPSTVNTLNQPTRGAQSRPRPDTRRWHSSDKLGEEPALATGSIGSCRSP